MAVGKAYIGFIAVKIKYLKIYKFKMFLCCSNLKNFKKYKNKLCADPTLNCIWVG
jgi:hypothetical protein